MKKFLNWLKSALKPYWGLALATCTLFASIVSSDFRQLAEATNIPLYIPYWTWPFFILIFARSQKKYFSKASKKEFGWGLIRYLARKSDDPDNNIFLVYLYIILWSFLLMLMMNLDGKHPGLDLKDLDLNNFIAIFLPLQTIIFGLDGILLFAFLLFLCDFIGIGLAIPIISTIFWLAEKSLSLPLVIKNLLEPWKTKKELSTMDPITRTIYDLNQKKNAYKNKIGSLHNLFAGLTTKADEMLGDYEKIILRHKKEDNSQAGSINYEILQRAKRGKKNIIEYKNNIEKEKQNVSLFLNRAELYLENNFNELEKTALSLKELSKLEGQDTNELIAMTKNLFSSKLSLYFTAMDELTRLIDKTDKGNLPEQIAGFIPSNYEELEKFTDKITNALKLKMEDVDNFLSIPLDQTLTKTK